MALKPDHAEAYNYLGLAYIQQGRMNEAVSLFQKALVLKPDYAEAHFNLGNALLQQGQMDEATAQYQKALALKPDYAEAHNNLGNVLVQQARAAEAIAHYQKALALKPDYADARNNLGNALLQQGRTDEALAHYQKALARKPDDADVQNKLAWLLATSPQASLRNGNQAVELAQRANQLAGGENPIVLCTLAAACAEAGRFPEAVAAAQRALPLAEAQSNTVLADELRSQLKLYQAGTPFHGPVSP
jgi:tetratricopeptide (TPR) repeat protein